MKNVIKYDLIGSYEEGVKEHPQLNTENLGMNVHRYKGEPIGDCVFMIVSNMPSELPKYIDLSEYKFN